MKFRQGKNKELSQMEEEITQENAMQAPGLNSRAEKEHWGETGKILIRCVL